MPRARRLPPLISDEERIEAARIAADKLCAELREADLIRAAWQEGRPAWSHYVDPAGAVHSRRQP